ncbi:VIT1/CCC1 family predicted Fe2+/Mn2+ transporter [Cryobacterium mesophilum]|uniref:Rubrerythrin family protein n=1 Tax=Terrimesophilobacter mesophilus TaxID=433647 RepID=A0A4R8VAL6_9MICO|nr:VIT1/CCC1 family protein [Terrimesophilobacter mesophilus]MBB5632807.1 VIT1/CCC1 family predicted Fe2+/Mn2+ transporter [Terrimesophilobacter mesophilus]TFB79595.1 rubrerythrin family protein [Terrimesophilobacter mesophilus]
MAAGSPTSREVRRWRRYLANERAEAATYRDLASRREGEERDILLALADAEGRHEEHWLTLLGDRVGPPLAGQWRTRVLGWLARRFGSVFVLALAQRAEARSPYESDDDATRTMAADERIHEEVIRGLAARGRARVSGSFRAAVFGANDGLVSNFALVLGVGATGVSNQFIVITGLAGLLAGALSMAAGEYVSISSQRELLESSAPSPGRGGALGHLDVNANELALVYRARGVSEDEASAMADAVLKDHQLDSGLGTDEHEEVGSARGAALSSFAFFAFGALVPVLPHIFGATGFEALAISAALVGVILLSTGAIVGLVSGGSPWKRAIRQLLIGYGAAAVTYVLGSLVGIWLA